MTIHIGYDPPVAIMFALVGTEACPIQLHQGDALGKG